MSKIDGNQTLDRNQTSFDSFYFYETEQLGALWFLLFTILIGNGITLVKLSGTKPRSRSRMHLFVRHLAIADLGVGVMCVLTDLIWHITIEWHAGNVICKTVKFAQVSVTYASTYILVGLSIDRYNAINHPMKISRSWRIAKLLIALAWIFGGLFSLPTCFLYEEKLVDSKKQCWIELPDQYSWQLYLTLIAFSLFFIPLIIIITCYVLILKTIWAKRSIPSVKKNMVLGPKGALLLKRASSKGVIPKAKVKTLKIAFTVVGVFIVCWSPYFIFDLLQVYGKVSQTQTNIAIATFIQSLAPLNSAANPFVYLLLSTNYFCNICSCMCWKSNNTKLQANSKNSQVTSSTITNGSIVSNCQATSIKIAK